MNASRRHFLKTAALYSTAFAGLRNFAVGRAAAATLKAEGYGPLRPDPARLMDLPEGFSYRVISRAGEEMSDRFITPGLPDGMATFPAGENRMVLIRNHEINPGARASSGPFGPNNELFARLSAGKAYDPGHRGRPCLGGTTSLLFNTATQTVERSYLSLAGSLRNCAGGPTPWNTWITCEETVVTIGRECAKDHGFNFEVPASPDIALADPIPLRDMGRFNHEAVAVDPDTGIVYQTEDRPDGLIYRFIPKRPGKLAEGGQLQALALGNRPVDTRNWTRQAIEPGEKRPAHWIDLKDVAARSDFLRYRGSTDGAATFARGEGMWFSNGVIYFACTNGGRARRGQIWKYHLADNQLELFIEPNDEALVDMCDNITVAPWGDLFLCEDGKGEQRVMGVTPEGGVFPFARNALSGSELAGACFSPDGSTLFVNIQKSGHTLAITGPWRRG